MLLCEILECNSARCTLSYPSSTVTPHNFVKLKSDMPWFNPGEAWTNNKYEWQPKVGHNLAITIKFHFFCGRRWLERNGVSSVMWKLGPLHKLTKARKHPTGRHDKMADKGSTISRCVRHHEISPELLLNSPFTESFFLLNSHLAKSLSLSKMIQRDWVESI